MLKCGDTMIKPHMLSQIPSSCLYIQLSVLATVPRILISSFPSHVMILFCTDMIESIEWQDLVPRQRTGDCLWIHIPHCGLCDPPLSRHQTFLLEVELRQCVFCKRLLLFLVLKQTSQSRSFGRGVEILCLPDTLLQDVPILSPEKCVRVRALLWAPDYL